MSDNKIKRLKNTAKIEFIEKKSVFIGFSTFVENEEQALAIIKQKKKEYSDATHNVYAYVIGDNIARYSDDNEPQGTAGMPVLNSIRMSGLTDVLVVVTRYFGGILLGAGGLVRAYSTCASMALEAGGVSVYENYIELKINCSYSDYGKLNTELSSFGAIIDKTDFGQEVCIDFAIREDILNAFNSKITDLFAGRIVPNNKGKRIDTK
ncbi:MAG: YigZ family protein [Clostridia bacterium]|nr:YigZ family protein [Clostridia bacterium]MBQ7788209.1 YigZ family protein [Clostridia bacterium]